MSTKKELREIWEAKERIANEFGNRSHAIAESLDLNRPGEKKFSEGLFMTARNASDAAQAAYLLAPSDEADATKDRR